MNKNIKLRFGEKVDGFSVPVLNEREIRAAAGIIFLIMFISVLTVILKGNFILLKYAITLFLTDMIIRVIISPKYSPTLIIGRLIVRNQLPEYVGAPQKKFAWIIGLVISSTMFILQIIVNSYGPITGILCFVCLIFLFFESAFGICIGCSVYSLFYREKVGYCPGNACENLQKAEIQKTSLSQLLVVIGFIAFLYLTVSLFNDDFKKEPQYLFKSTQAINTQAINQ
jgi:hypothetical protein